MKNARWCGSGKKFKIPVASANQENQVHRAMFGPEKQSIRCSDQGSAVTFWTAFTNPTPRCFWADGHSGRPRFLPTDLGKTRIRSIWLSVLSSREDSAWLSFSVLKRSKMITKDSHISLGLGLKAAGFKKLASARSCLMPELCFVCIFLKA